MYTNFNAVTKKIFLLSINDYFIITISLYRTLIFLSSALRTPKANFDVIGVRIIDSNRRDHPLMALRKK